MNRLLIVDGRNLLFQMFFGMPARIVNDQGKAILGTLYFMGIRHVETTNCETDDMVAAYALAFG